jgi:hypothetical protein
VAAVLRPPVLKPADASVPQAAPEHPVPDRLHKISVLGLDPATGEMVAKKSRLVPALIPELTEPAALSASVKWLVMVILAVADFAGSATLVAVTVTLGGEGRICGAMKSPAEFTVPHAAPEQPAPVVFQITAVDGFPAEVMLD